MLTLGKPSSSAGLPVPDEVFLNKLFVQVPSYVFLINVVPPTSGWWVKQAPNWNKVAKELASDNIGLCFILFFLSYHVFKFLYFHQTPFFYLATLNSLSFEVTASHFDCFLVALDVISLPSPLQCGVISLTSFAVFGDVNLQTDPIRDAKYGPGAGGWPTVCFPKNYFMCI